MKKSTRKNLRKLLVITATVILSIMCACVICSAQDATGSGFGTVLNEFIDILVGGITGMGEGLGDGVNTFVSSLFFELDGSGNVTGLSNFGGTAAIFGGIALAVGITTAIFLWIRSLGR